MAMKGLSPNRWTTGELPSHIHFCLFVGAPSKVASRDFPGGPVADSKLPMQGAKVLSLVREQNPAATTKDPACSNKDQRSLVPQPGAAK